MPKEIYYVEIDDCGTFVAGESEESAIDFAIEKAKTNRDAFFAIKLNGQPPQSERFGSGLPFTTQVSCIQKAQVPGYNIKLEEIAKPEIKDETPLWYAEVRNRQVFTILSESPGATRDFDYVIFMAAKNEDDAKKQAKERLFRTPEKFFEEYYNDNCPPPQYFDLECSITYMREVRLPSYKITLEKIYR